MEPKGAINGYLCDKCNKLVYTIIVDKGTTPSGIGCRATEGCGGRSMSLFYPGLPTDTFGNILGKGEQELTNHVLHSVSFEWFRPKLSNLDDVLEDSIKHLNREDRRGLGGYNLKKELISHYNSGGLFIRALSDEGKDVLKEFHYIKEED